MKQHTLLLSLPNSGSTWLASIIAKHSSHRYFDMEFFNPLRNPKYEHELLPRFGCELISALPALADDGNTRELDRVFRRTWALESYTFDKEVFSSWKLPWFVRHFHVVVLLRSAPMTFPPSRLRILSFYEHLWFSIRSRGDISLSGTSIAERVREAHQIASARLTADAVEYDCPILNYELLACGNASQIEEAIGNLQIKSVDARKVAEEIFTMRRTPHSFVSQVAGVK